jgi:hypothetical protein
MNKESIFDKFDEYIGQKQGLEAYFVHILVFIILAFISYIYIYPYTDENLKRSKKEFKELNQKVNKERRFLAANAKNGDVDYAVKKAKKELEGLKNDYKKAKDLNEYIDGRLKEVSTVLYNNEVYTEYIDYIAITAKKNRIILNSISNNFYEQYFQKVTQAVDIAVDAYGECKDMIRFINDLEKTDTFADIFSFKIKKTLQLSQYADLNNTFDMNDLIFTNEAFEKYMCSNREIDLEYDLQSAETDTGNQSKDAEEKDTQNEKENIKDKGSVVHTRIDYDRNNLYCKMAKNCNKEGIDCINSIRFQLNIALWGIEY